MRQQLMAPISRLFSLGLCLAWCRGAYSLGREVDIAFLLLLLLLSLLLIIVCVFVCVLTTADLIIDLCNCYFCNCFFFVLL